MKINFHTSNTMSPSSSEVNETVDSIEMLISRTCADYNIKQRDILFNMNFDALHYKVKQVSVVSCILHFF